MRATESGLGLCMVTAGSLQLCGLFAGLKRGSPTEAEGCILCWPEELLCCHSHAAARLG